MFTIGSIRSELSLFNFLRIYRHESNSPLYFIFAFFWYRLVPHTEQALLSLSIIFTILAAIVTGLTGYKLSGIKLGILSFLFVIFNRANLAFAAYEFRAYSLLILVAAVTIYFYLSRLQDESWLNIILYGVSMSLLPYTHYASVLLCFGLFIADCVLIARKHASLKVIASYFIGALLFLPCFILFVLPKIGLLVTFRHDVITISSLLNLMTWLTSSRSFLDLPFLLTLMGAIYIIFNVGKNKFLFIGLFSSVFMILSVFIYSKFINPTGTFFIYRYFFSLMPFISLLTASGTDYLYTKLKPVFKDKNILIFTIILLTFCSINLFHIRDKKAGNFEPHREVADIIYQNEQSFKGTSAIIYQWGGVFLKGWEEMYLTKDHTRKAPVVFCLGDKKVLKQIQTGNYDRIYFCYLHGQLGTSELIEWLRKNYYFSGKIENYDFYILERMKQYNQ